MFYSSFILWYRTPLGRVWNAAHKEKKLKRKQVENIALEEIIVQILRPPAPLSLRTSSMLMLGVVRIYAAKVAFLKRDVEAASRAAVRAKANIDLPSAPTRLVPLTELPKVDLEEVFGGLGGVVRYARVEDDRPEDIDQSLIDGTEMQPWIVFPAEWQIPESGPATNSRSKDESSSTTSREGLMEPIPVPRAYDEPDPIPEPMLPPAEYENYEDVLPPPIDMEVDAAEPAAAAAAPVAAAPKPRKERFAVVNDNIQIGIDQMKKYKEHPEQFCRVATHGPQTRQDYILHMEEGLTWEQRWILPGSRPLPSQNRPLSRIAYESTVAGTLVQPKKKARAVRTRAEAEADAKAAAPAPDAAAAGPAGPVDEAFYPPPPVDNFDVFDPLPEHPAPEEDQPPAKRQKVPAHVVEPNVLTVRRTAERMDQLFEASKERIPEFIFNDAFVRGKSARYQAESFFDLLVLATHGKVGVYQDRVATIASRRSTAIKVTKEPTFSAEGLPAAVLASVAGPEAVVVSA